MLRAGIVGAGVFGGFHAGKYAASPDAAVAAVYDPRADRAATLAEAHGAHAFATYDDFLDAVDVLTIAAPADVHFALGMHALKRGRHVYMEKPLALRSDHADSLTAAAERNGVVLQVGHQERVVLDALDLFSTGAPLKRLEFARCGPASGRGEDVSVIFDLMIHDLDIAAYLGCGALRQAHAAGDVHDVAATLEFEGGVSASFLASRRCDSRKRSMTAIYDDGVVELDFINRRYRSTRPCAASRKTPAEPVCDPLGVSVNCFIDAVRDGATARIPGGEASRAVLLAERVEAALTALNCDAGATLPEGERLTA